MPTIIVMYVVCLPRIKGIIMPVVCLPWVVMYGVCLPWVVGCIDKHGVCLVTLVDPPASNTA